MTALSYIKRVIYYSITISIVVLAFNYFVDPYAITGAKRVDGFNRYKADINNHTRLSKKYHPLFEQHNALIVGNSRVEMGINPSHDCFIENDWRIYNLGIPGASVRQQLAYALNVMYQQPIRKVWLTVDFTDFLLTAGELERDFPDMGDLDRGTLKYLPSGERNPDYARIMLLDYYKALFSLDATMSSIKTLALQRPASADRDELGFNPARDFAQAVTIEGAAALFEQKLAILEKSYGREFYLRDRAGRLGQSFEDLASFLSVSTQQDVRVTLIINPFHEKYWELLQSKGLLGLHQQWLGEISGLAGEYSNVGVRTWDFSRDSIYIHEQVPPSGTNSGPLDWFWEPAHYREQLGDLMVEAIMSDSCGSAVKFGRRLN